MLIWWAAFPLLVMGVYFTVKYRLRQALPILLFTTMLTLAYSVFQGNVGTAYRQRSQILVFYFIFVAVGAVLLKEKREDKQREQWMLREVAKERNASLARPHSAAPRGGRHEGMRLPDLGPPRPSTGPLVSGARSGGEPSR
jgi:Ca2+/Na+ antiporter